MDRGNARIGILNRRKKMRKFIVLFVMLFVAQGAFGVDLAKAKTKYEEKTKEIEKKLGKKKKSKKGKKKYQEAMADAMGEYLYAVAYSAIYERKDKDLQKKLKAEEKELEDKLLELFKDGALVQVTPGDLKFEPLQKGLGQHCERLAAKEFNDEEFVQWVACERSSTTIFRFVSYKGINIIQEHIFDNAKLITSCFTAGQATAHIYYIKAPADKKKVKMSFVVSKGDKIEKIYVNGRKVKGTKKFKANLRTGVNSIVVFGNNTKDMVYEYALKISGKGYEVGKPKR